MDECVPQSDEIFHKRVILFQSLSQALLSNTQKHFWPVVFIKAEMHSRLQTQNTSITADLLWPHMWGSVNALGMNMYGRGQFKSVCLCALSIYERRPWKGHFTFISLKSGAVCVCLNVAQLKGEKKTQSIQGAEENIFQSNARGLDHLHDRGCPLHKGGNCVLGVEGHGEGWSLWVQKPVRKNRKHALVFDRWSPQR